MRTRAVPGAGWAPGTPLGPRATCSVCERTLIGRRAGAALTSSLVTGKGGVSVSLVPRKPGAGPSPGCWGGVISADLNAFPEIPMTHAAGAGSGSLAGIGATPPWHGLASTPPTAAVASRTIGLRPWQREAADARENPQCPPDFLADATPGTGKTSFGLAARARHPRRAPRGNRRGSLPHDSGPCNTYRSCRRRCIAP